MRRTGPRAGREAGRRSGLSLPGPERRNPLGPVERREAQRFGGEASHAFRSSPARASGQGLASPSEWGTRKTPFRQGATVFGGNAGHHKGAVAQRPGASRRSIPFWETEKGTGGAHAETK